MLFEGKKIVFDSGFICVGNAKYLYFKEGHDDLDFSLPDINSFIFDLSNKPQNSKGVYVFAFKNKCKINMLFFDRPRFKSIQLNKIWRGTIKKFSIIKCETDQIFCVGSDNEMLSRARQHLVSKKIDGNASLRLSLWSRRKIKKHLYLIFIPVDESTIGISKTELESAIRKEYNPLFSNK